MRIWRMTKFTSEYNISLQSGSSSGYGYINGGGVASWATGISYLEKLSFSTYVNSLLGTTTSFPRSFLGGFQSSTNGYWANGYTSSSPADSYVIDRMSFSTEVNTTHSKTMPSAKNGIATFSSSLVGYVAGGASGYRNDIQTLTFSSGNTATLAAVLAVARHNATGVQSSIKGYAAGGWISSGNSSEIDGILFSNNTQINPSAVLSVAVKAPTGVQSSSNGYICGGTTNDYYTASSSGFRNEVRILNFSNDTASNFSGGMTYGRPWASGHSSATEGFIVGGGCGGLTSGSSTGHVTTTSIEKIVFSNNTISTIAAVVNSTRHAHAGVSSPSTAL